PFGALDAKVRTELRRWLRDLHERLHFTSIFVTHDQEEALEIADRIVLTNQGRIEQTGTPEEVFHNPANEFVMRFLGEVNVFHARVDENAAGQVSLKERGDLSDANLLIRPHDFQIHLENPPKGSPIAAVIQKIRTAGPIVRIDMSDEENKAILVHLSHEEFRAMSPACGQRVFLTPRQLKIYANGKKKSK
ncbi:MAG: TOBE-like domain-containing protein, partial [Candidatus Marinimicrobia bacterium]|nr:TOBE-like domain-containing protein [Candidatus Neomarinimicrobiota bacterium]